jgi:hypothetical protein
MKMYRGVEVQLYAFLFSTLHAGEWSPKEITKGWTCSSHEVKNKYITVLLKKDHENGHYYTSTYALVIPVFSFLKPPNQNPVNTSPLPICATCPAHLILLDLIALTLLGAGLNSRAV